MFAARSARAVCVIEGGLGCRKVTDAESPYLLLLGQPLLRRNRVFSRIGERMFVTSPHFEVPVPKSLLPKGGSCFQSVSLSTSSAWFVLTTAHEEKRSKMYQTTLVSWASTLRTLLEGLEGSCVVGIQWVRPTEGAGRWALADVNEVWLPAELEEADTGVLLFKTATAERLLNERGAPVAQELKGRNRLVVVGV